VRRGGFVSCTCGFNKTVVLREEAYKVKDEHLKSTMPASVRPSSQVGHWLFLPWLTRDNKDQTWTCQCSLCGHVVVCTDLTGRLLPLTGSLYRKRREHDKKSHPNTLIEQKKAENAMLSRPPRR
jgi:hypothetical protein